MPVVTHTNRQDVQGALGGQELLVVAVDVEVGEVNSVDLGEGGADLRGSLAAVLGETVVAAGDERDACDESGSGRGVGDGQRGGGVFAG